MLLCADGFCSGLSYGKHSLGALAVNVLVGRKSSLNIRPTDGGQIVVIASVVVNDVGHRASPAVIQIYVQDPVGSTMHVRPWKRLVAFAKVFVPAGSSVPLHLPVRA